MFFQQNQVEETAKRRNKINIFGNTLSFDRRK